MTRRVFQVHATLNGELQAFVQREYPEPYSHNEAHALLREARDEVVRIASEKGGYDDIMFHEEESAGFLRAEKP